VHVADRPAHLTALTQTFNAAMAATVEFRLKRKAAADGEAEDRFVWVEMRCRPVIGADGNVVAVVAVTHDISARRTEESDLREAREVAERASLAKSQFLAHMSHELRTPLNAIIGFSEILEKDVIPDLDIVRQREYAKLIHASGQHLLDVVNSILDMSKIESGSFEIFAETLDVAPLVQSCCHMMRSQAEERGIALAHGDLSGLPEISADRRALRQILLNLLANAIKFTDRGGRVSVAARAAEGIMTLAVSDTGIGIAAADLPRLGDPFFQAKGSYDRAYEGTGLGLSVVRGLVGLHGGRLTVESAPGVGTRVSVRLPVGGVAQASEPAKIVTFARAPRRGFETKEPYRLTA
jgi:cell cycle sensor histidine kinase DivJ